jgi:phosphatidylserine decarboxylase
VLATKLGTIAAAQLVRMLPRVRISRAVGRLSDLRLPPRVARRIVGLYTRAYGVDLSEAEIPQPDGSFRSFDDFFTRKLRPGSRPTVSGPDDVLSPADGWLEAVGTITAGGSVRVKGRDYRIGELLASEDEAARYQGGPFAVIYLSPRDYHRVHAPVRGQLSEVRSSPGEAFPVNSVGERIPKLLVRNRRVAMALDTATSGRVTVVMVAAFAVGRISVTGFGERDMPLGIHRPEPRFEVAAGAELGVFHLGSTVVVLAEPMSTAQWTRKLGPIRVADPFVAPPPLASTPEAPGRGNNVDG